MFSPFRPKLQLKVVQPDELLQGSANSTIGNFTSVRAASLFLASLLAKLPLDLLDVTDVYGKNQFFIISSAIKMLSFRIFFKSIHATLVGIVKDKQ